MYPMNEMVNFAGMRVYETDIREDNLQNLYWATRDEGLIKLKDMPDAHLRNVALMLMGFGYQVSTFEERHKILWLTALRLEWERRQKLGIRVERHAD